MAKVTFGKVARIAAITVGALVVLAVAGFIAWAANPLGPSDRALAAMESDGIVRVSEVDGWYLFEPMPSDVMNPDSSVQATVGLVFYPGGHVDVRSYAPLCRATAERGVLVVLQPMPLSLAVFGIDLGNGPVSAFPDVETWGVAGHSLGGAMAAQWFAGTPAKVRGLALLGAWPPDSVDFSATASTFVSIYGANDGGAAEIAASEPRFPPGTPFVVIEGGNHGQIGDYGLQPGDGDATISHEDEQRQAADAVVEMLHRAAVGNTQP